MSDIYFAQTLRSCIYQVYVNNSDLCRGESEFQEIAHFHPTFTNARPARGCLMATNYSTCNSRSVSEYEQNVLFYSQCKCKVTVRI